MKSKVKTKELLREFSMPVRDMVDVGMEERKPGEP